MARTRSVLAALALLAPAAATPALACPVCYGQSDSPMAAGINMGIWVLLGVTGLVLSGFLTLILNIWRRSRRQERRTTTVPARVRANEQEW